MLLSILGSIVVVALVVAAIFWIIKCFEGVLRVSLILVLCMLALGLITNPAAAASLGWFGFAAVCLIGAWLIISFLKGQEADVKEFIEMVKKFINALAAFLAEIAFYDFD